MALVNRKVITRWAKDLLVNVVSKMTCLQMRLGGDGKKPDMCNKVDRIVCKIFFLPSIEKFFGGCQSSDFYSSAFVQRIG